VKYSHNYTHFVVLNGFKGDKAYLNDPANGTYTVSMEQFDKFFTGICLIFEPGENFVPSGNPRSILSYAKKRLSGAGTAVTFVVMTTFITSLIGIMNPVFSRVFIDRLLTGRNPQWEKPFLLFLSLLAIIQIIVAWIQAIYAIRIDGKLAVVGNTTFMWKVLRMPMEFFSQRMAGDIQSRQNANGEVARTLVNTLAPLILNAIMMFFYLSWCDTAYFLH